MFDVLTLLICGVYFYVSWWTSRSCVSMEASHLTLKPWIKFEPLSGTRRSPTKEHFVIWCGQTLRTWTHGPSAPEELAGSLVQRSQMRSLLLLLLSSAHIGSSVHVSFKAKFWDGMQIHNCVSRFLSHWRHTKKSGGQKKYYVKLL